jgi:hypothetical protein
VRAESQRTTPSSQRGGVFRISFLSTIMTSIEGHHRDYSSDEIRMLRKAAGLNVIPPDVVSRNHAKAAQERVEAGVADTRGKLPVLPDLFC